MQFLRNLVQLFAFILRYTKRLKHARLLAGVVVVLGIVAGFANTALIAVVNHVINDSGASRQMLAWAFVGICTLLPICRYFAETTLQYLAEMATLDLRLTMSRRMLAAPLRTVEKIGGPRVMSALANDTPSVVNALTSLPVLCMNTAVVAGSLIYMGMLSWRILLGVLCFILLGIVLYQLPLLRAQVHIQAVRDRYDDLFRHFRAIGDAVKELKLHHQRRHAFLEGRLRDTTTQIRVHNLSAQRLFAAAASWGQVLSFIVIGLIAFVLPTMGFTDKVLLTGYTLAILYIVSPIQVLLNAMPQLGRAVAAMRRLEEIGLSLAEFDRPLPEVVPGQEPIRWSSLELDGVTHSYYSEREQSEFTLGPIHLAFRPGEIVFVTGGNGSGKTTLAKLLTGLYMPESGQIRLDGEPVTEDNLPRYNELFSVVFSDFYLFDSLLGLDEQNVDEQAEHLLRELHLERKVEVKDGKLSTTSLSTGQRKRLALLTAYLEDRPIYLFDEWAADQDPHFKNVFYHEVITRLKEQGKTVFVISHDDRYFHLADRMVKLEYGQVVVGSADEPLDVELAVASRAGEA